MRLKDPLDVKFYTCKVFDSSAVHMNFALPCSQLRAIIAALRIK